MGWPATVRSGTGRVHQRRQVLCARDRNRQEPFSFAVQALVEELARRLLAEEDGQPAALGNELFELANRRFVEMGDVGEVNGRKRIERFRRQEPGRLDLWDEAGFGRAAGSQGGGQVFPVEGIGVAVDNQYGNGRRDVDHDFPEVVGRQGVGIQLDGKSFSFPIRRTGPESVP